jgi:hypothetical protein
VFMPLVMRIFLYLGFSLLATASPLWGARLASAEGQSSVIINGSDLDASDNINESLPLGTVIRTGPDSIVMVELAPGSLVEIQPNSEVVIGDLALAPGVAASGSVSPSGFDISRYFPQGVSVGDITPEQYAEAVYAAVLENPDRAAEIASASFQSVVAAGRYTQRGGKQDVDPDGSQSDPSADEWGSAIGDAAKRAAPEMSQQIDSALGPLVAQTASGNQAGQPSVTVNSGTIVVLTAPGAPLAVIVTPLGSVEVVEPGQTVVSVVGTNPSNTTVTVASTAGSDMVTTMQGEQIPVAEGLAVILTPDGNYQAMNISDLPNGNSITSIAQNAAQNAGGLDLPPPPPPLVPTEPPLPPDPPLPTPTPTPTPKPTPVSP